MHARFHCAAETSTTETHLQPVFEIPPRSKFPAYGVPRRRRKVRILLECRLTEMLIVCDFPASKWQSLARAGLDCGRRSYRVCGHFSVMKITPPFFAKLPSGSSSAERSTPTLVQQLDRDQKINFSPN